jgi:hypothetical protein
VTIGLAGDSGAPPQLCSPLFGEDQARYLVSASLDDAAFLKAAGRINKDVPYQIIGSVETIADGNRVSLAWSDRNVANVPLSRLREAHENWLPNYMNAVD